MSDALVTSATKTLFDNGSSYGSKQVVAPPTDINYPEIPTVEPAVSLQRFVDEATGNDANDGQLVTNGGTGPWATFAHAYEQLADSVTWRVLNLVGTVNCAGTLGSTVTKFMGTTPGTLSEPAIIRGLAGSSPVLNITIGDIVPNNQSHILWYGFGITGTHGIELDNDLPTHWHTFRKINGVMSGLGGDNQPILGGNANNYFGVFDCDLQGAGDVGGGVHGNTACVLIFNMVKFRIENNRMRTAPRPLYVKHGKQLTANDNDWAIKNNWCGAGSVNYGSFIASSYGTVSNNIFEGDLDISNGGGAEAPINNVFDHNTILGDMIIRDGDAASEINGHQTINSIIQGDYKIDPSGTSAYTNTCTSNYNLIGVDIVFQGVTYNTVAAWNAVSVPANQDANSIDGLPTFTGGATPTTVAGYQLNGGNGANAANDGSDMGVDVSIVGVRA